MRHATAVAVWLWLLLSVMAGSGQAQTFDVVVQDPHVKVLAGLLAEWDEKKLTFPAKRLLTEEFTARVRQRFQTKLGGYENEAWLQMVLNRWNALPSDLGPQLPLTGGAKLAILSGYADNLSSVRASNVAANREAVFKHSMVGLYAVLGSSQVQAIEQRKKAITSTEIQDALAAFKTGVYPICREPQPSDR